MEFLMSIIGNLIASQLYETLPSVAKWLIARAAARLTIKNRDRYSEEWLSHLSRCDGNLAKFFHAVGCFKASYIMRPLGDRVEGNLLHVLNERFNTRFILILIKRYIPSARPKTIYEHMVYYKDVVVIEIPYIIVRKFSLIMCPEMVKRLDIFQHKWIYELILKPAGRELWISSDLLPYWDEVELHDEVDLQADD